MLSAVLLTGRAALRDESAPQTSTRAKIANKYVKLRDMPWYKIALNIFSDPLHLIALMFTIIGVAMMSRKVIDLTATSVVRITAVMLLVADVCKGVVKVVQLAMFPLPDDPACHLDIFPESEPAGGSSQNNYLNSSILVSELKLKPNPNSKPNPKPKRRCLKKRAIVALQMFLELVGIMLTLACTVPILVTESDVTNSMVRAVFGEQVCFSKLNFSF
jgi:hypothetical protein